MKAELKAGSINQVIKGNDIFVCGEKAAYVGLVLKGRVRAHTQGANLVLGSGQFLGLCDLTEGQYHFDYTAEMNSAIYVFPAQELIRTVKEINASNKEYRTLMVSRLSKFVCDMGKIYAEMEEKARSAYEFIKESYQNCRALGDEYGVEIGQLEEIQKLKPPVPGERLQEEDITYYEVCSSLRPEIQKVFFGASDAIVIHHVKEQVALICEMLAQCKADAEYLQELFGPLMQSDNSLYAEVINLTMTLQRMDESDKESMKLFDQIIDQVNSLESLLLERADIDLQIDHEAMENTYFTLINRGESRMEAASLTEEFALVEGNFVSVDVLEDSLQFIVDYSEIEPEKATQFIRYIKEFENLQDKASTDDPVRQLRRNIQKIYYELYEKVFRRDYREQEETPLAVDLFLRYGFLSETLLTEELLEELLTFDHYDSGRGDCRIYDMKEWLTEIYEGRKEPSKSEFDLDYAESLREQKKTGRITESQMKELARDQDAKLSYEIQNMFRTNHRPISGQVSTFVPFLYTEGCASSLLRSYLSKEKISACIRKLRQIDFSVFYREILYVGEDIGIKKEYIMKEVVPDVLLLPGSGSKGVMWQELSGRKRDSKGRFLLPHFFEGDLERTMIELFGRFRWELCRTMQGTSWNNIQIKSLTSEYSDYIQFYRKNRELSEDRKEKLKMQIQKCRNNTREVFVVDYVNWIRHEANGGLLLNKPVREIMATYCPFVKEIRESVADQPLFRDAMARFQREVGRKQKEFDLKFRVWEKDAIIVPQEIIETRDYYKEK